MDRMAAWRKSRGVATAAAARGQTTPTLGPPCLSVGLRFQSRQGWCWLATPPHQCRRGVHEPAQSGSAASTLSQLAALGALPREGSCGWKLARGASPGPLPGGGPAWAYASVETFGLAASRPSTQARGQSRRAASASWWNAGSESVLPRKKWQSGILGSTIP